LAGTAMAAPVLRIVSCPGLVVFKPKATNAPQLDPLARGQSWGEGRKDCIDRCFDFLL
jgi:hypothetical protein